MWVPMTEWTILMLHGVARLPATAAGDSKPRLV